MKVGIMQPYLFPYLGYFQLIHAVDVFVILDDVQYIKAGWINRNRILIHHEPKVFTFPVTKDSYTEHINKRYYNGDSFETNKKNFLDLVYHSYNKAPCFSEVFDVIKKITEYSSLNVAELNAHSLQLLCGYLGIDTEFVVASRLGRNSSLNREDAVIEMSRLVGADCCITPKGGELLYSKDAFRNHGIDLWFLEMNGVTYPQFGREFVPSLSIIDVIMFNLKEDIQELLQSYTLS